jgi:hypothetical protein
MRFATRRIADYAEHSAKLKAALEAQNHKQPGDPERLAAAILKLALHGQPPLRFAAGTDAVAALTTKLDRCTVSSTSGERSRSQPTRHDAPRGMFRLRRRRDYKVSSRERHKCLYLYFTLLYLLNGKNEYGLEDFTGSGIAASTTTKQENEMPKGLKVTSGSIMCAAALLSAGAAQAQSSVTLFGLVDGGLLYTSKTLNTQTGGNAGKQLSLIDGGSSYSQFGLIGTQDLGGGLSVKFKLESGISVANGGIAHCNGNLFGCEAWVGLNSNRFGEVKAGLQFSPFFLALYESDPRNMSFFGSGGVNLVDNLLGTSIFSPNAVSYSSPSLWGFKASVLYSFGGQPGDFQAGRQYAASLRYVYGGLMINAAMFDGNSVARPKRPRRPTSPHKAARSAHLSSSAR